MPTSRPIAWHPSFASACQLELLKFKDGLYFETEHELNAQPLRIDLLVVKKDPGLQIDLDIAAIFRGHNILEFKSEQDGLNFDDLCKVIGYGCLYKAYGTRTEPVELDDVTLTLVRHKKPVGLFGALAKHGFRVAPSSQGIYRIEGLMFPAQAIVTGELDPKDHIWLASLASDLETRQIELLLNAAVSLRDERDRALVDSVMDAVALANNDAIEQLMEEDDMYKTLREIMGTDPRFFEELAQVRLEAATEAAVEAGAKAMEKGMERGMEAAARATVERLVRRGGFTDEEIAELAGTTTAEVRKITESMQAAVA